MDKDELIRKQAKVAKSKARMVKQASKRKSGGGPKLESLDFTSFQRTAFMVVQDIQKQAQASFFSKMRMTLLKDSNDEGGNHTDGSIIASVDQSEKAQALVAELAKNPLASPKRIKLLKLVGGKKDQELSFYRNVMIQGSIPIYIGNITPLAMQVAAQTYRLYLKKICYCHKKTLLLVRSKQLKSVNVDMIPIEDIINSENPPENPQEALLILEIKIALRLIDMSKDLDETIRGSMTWPVDLSELDEFSPSESSPSKPRANNKKKMVMHKSIAVMNVARGVPMLHSMGLKLGNKLQKLDSQLPSAFLMEARVHMYAVKVLNVRMEQGDYSVRDAIAPTFNKAIAAYRKGLKRISSISPSRADAANMAEFCRIAHFAHMHRDSMRLTREGVAEILKIAKKAIDAAVLVDRRHSALQMRLIVALNAYGITED